MNEERNFEVNEGIEMVEEVCDVAKKSHKGSGKLVIATIITSGVVTTIAIVNKKLGLLDKWRVKRLEKKGYNVIPPFDIDTQDLDEKSKITE